MDTNPWAQKTKSLPSFAWAPEKKEIGSPPALGLNGEKGDPTKVELLSSFACLLQASQLRGNVPCFFCFSLYFLVPLAQSSLSPTPLTTHSVRPNQPPSPSLPLATLPHPCTASCLASPLRPAFCHVFLLLWPACLLLILPLASPPKGGQGLQGGRRAGGRGSDRDRGGRGVLRLLLLGRHRRGVRRTVRGGREGKGAVRVWRGWWGVGECRGGGGKRRMGEQRKEGTSHHLLFPKSPQEATNRPSTPLPPLHSWTALHARQHACSGHGRGACLVGGKWPAAPHTHTSPSMGRLLLLPFFSLSVCRVSSAHTRTHQATTTTYSQYSTVSTTDDDKGARERARVRRQTIDKPKKGSYPPSPKPNPTCVLSLSLHSFPIQQWGALAFASPLSTLLLPPPPPLLDPRTIGC